jgi:selenocysteine lyase/cysteine desulfurase
VNGIREFARARGAETTYVPSEAPDLRVDESLLPLYLTEVGGDHHNLFAYPAQSNFSGVQHPLAWIEQAQEHGWDVLLDAAAYVATNRLDLSRWKPDFVVLSFYKMFGWPTGIGVLVARREALAKLERPWFSGGTIIAAFVQREWHQSAPGAAHFEDGTVDFLNVPAVEIGLRHLEGIGVEAIHRHVEVLATALLEVLESLRHTNGEAAATIYGPRDVERRGATIAFNFLRPDGSIVDERYVDRVAHEHGISLRTGCFCNPGAGELAFTIERETLVGGEFGDGMTIDDYVDAIGLPSGGAVRASLGLASNRADIERFAAFAGEFIDCTEVPADLPPRIGC